MQKNQAYHEAAIAYNEGLAEAAEKLADTLGHEEPQRWCRAVAKQHRFHAKRHQSALEKLMASESSDEEVVVEHIPDGLDLPEPVVETNQETEKVDLFVAGQEEPVSTSVEIIQEAPAESEVHEDGCVGFHNPTDPNCAYSPKTEGTDG